MDNNKSVDIVIPVYNEEDSIGDTLREIFAVLRKINLTVRFIICEDGSKDRTVEVLRKISAELPITLITGQVRKGYAQAIIDGARQSDAEMVLFVDGDGQCGPESLPAMFEELTDNDMVIGWRNPRHDVKFRLIISAAFKILYRCVFGIRLKDPSYACVLIKKDPLKRIMRQNLGLMVQGFWWEFNARAQAMHLRVAEIPVMHRNRISGKTRVYHFRKLPAIAFGNIRSLLILRSELSNYSKNGKFP